MVDKDSKADSPRLCCSSQKHTAANSCSSWADEGLYLEIFDIWQHSRHMPKCSQLTPLVCRFWYNAQQQAKMQNQKSNFSPPLLSQRSITLPVVE